MDMKRLTKVALFTPGHRGRWGLPIAFRASPGTSKTAQIRQVAAECGLPCEILSPGERGEGAFGVVPVPRDNILTYPPADWIQKFQPQTIKIDAKTGKNINIPEKDQVARGIVFVDELTTAPPALQPPLLGLFLDGRIGGTELPPGVRCISAYNDVDEAAAGYDLPPPLANRMGHIPFDPGGVEEWTNWLVGTNGVEDNCAVKINAAAEEKRVLEAWPEAFAIAKGKAVAFLRTRPALLHKMPPPHDAAASKAWPSRRTWEFAIRSMASSVIHGVDEDIETQLIAAFVGDAIAGELYTFLRDEDLPDPAEILDGAIEFKHDSRRLDRSFAILAACTALVVPENAKKRDDRGKALWNVITKIAKDGAKDVVFGAAQRLAKTGHLSHVEARPALAMLQGIMEAAGIGGR
jgi:MoxR-like ATPase